jgi:hypothetical protein
MRLKKLKNGRMKVIQPPIDLTGFGGDANATIANRTKKLVKKKKKKRSSSKSSQSTSSQNFGSRNSSI